MGDKPTETTSNHEEWGNGITLKKTRDGYRWTIAVRSESGSVDDMKKAAATARALDEEFAARYGSRRS